MEEKVKVSKKRVSCTRAYAPFPATMEAIPKPWVSQLLATYPKMVRRCVGSLSYAFKNVKSTFSPITLKHLSF